MFLDEGGVVVQYCEDSVYVASDHRLLWLNYDGLARGVPLLDKNEWVARLQLFVLRNGAREHRLDLLSCPQDVLVWAEYFNDEALASASLEKWEVAPKNARAKRVSLIDAPAMALRALPNDCALSLDPAQGTVRISHELLLSMVLGRMQLRAQFYDSGEADAHHWFGFTGRPSAFAIGVHPSVSGSYAFYSTLEDIEEEWGARQDWQVLKATRSEGWHTFEFVVQDKWLSMRVDGKVAGGIPLRKFIGDGERICLGAASGGIGVWRSVELLHTPPGDGTWEVGVHKVHSATYTSWAPWKVFGADGDTVQLPVETPISAEVPASSLTNTTGPLDSLLEEAERLVEGEDVSPNACVRDSTAVAETVNPLKIPPSQCLDPLELLLSGSPRSWSSEPELSEDLARLIQVDWEAVDSRLPLLQVPRQKAERKVIFRKLDTNKNGFLSLSEILAGLPGLLEEKCKRKTSKASKDICYIVPLTDFAPAIKLAFNEARGVAPPKGKTKKQRDNYDDTVDPREFHALLLAFRVYIELDVIFKAIDSDADRRIHLDETGPWLPVLAQWNIPADAARAIPELQTKVGMKFDDFAEWCVRHRFGQLELHLDVNDAEQTVKDIATGQGSKDGILMCVETFKDWDTNGDGSISVEEFAAVLMALDKKFTREKASELFAAADANKDGRVDYAEFFDWICR
jgi:hypothetical protein